MNRCWGRTERWWHCTQKDLIRWYCCTRYNYNFELSRASKGRSLTHFLYQHDQQKTRWVLRPILRAPLDLDYSTNECLHTTFHAFMPQTLQEKWLFQPLLASRLIFVYILQRCAEDQQRDHYQSVHMLCWVWWTTEHHGRTSAWILPKARRWKILAGVSVYMLTFAFLSFSIEYRNSSEVGMDVSGIKISKQSRFKRTEQITVSEIQKWTR
jgi:hypothetical protein